MRKPPTSCNCNTFTSLNPLQNHRETILNLYRKHDNEKEFWLSLRWYFDHGYVVSTPGFFAMYQPIARGAVDVHALALRHEPSDAWFVHALAGDMESFIASLPYPLPYFAFARSERGRGLRFFPFNRIKTLSHKLNHG